MRKKPSGWMAWVDEWVDGLGGWVGGWVGGQKAVYRIAYSKKKTLPQSN